MAPPTPAAVATGPLRLLDDIPNYAAALKSQWSGDDLPPRLGQYLVDTSHYGRLRELSGPQSLKLTDCVGLALSNNTSLEISRLGPLGARAQVRRSYGIFDPSLFADVSTDRSEVAAAGFFQSGTLAPPTIPAPKSRLETLNLTGDLGLRKLLLTGGQVTLSLHTNRQVTNNAFLSDFDPQYQTNALLSLNQPLLRDFGLSFTTLQVRIASTNEQSAVKQYEAAITTLIKSVEQAYWALVQANENVSVQEQSLALAREVQRQNESKFKVGAVPRTAVLEAQADVARREANLIQGQNARSIARDSLRALINAGHEPDGSLLVVEPADAPTVEAYPIDLDRSLAMALEQRPELAAAKLTLKSSGMQLKIAENQLLPRLNATGNVGTSGLSGNGRTTGVNLSTLMTGPKPQNLYTGPYERSYNGLVDGRYYSYSAGLNIEVPLSNAQARADYATSRVNVEQSRLGLQQQQENITLEVKTAVTNLQSDLKSVDATRVARELAEENLRNQKARYDVGLATTKDLLDYLDRLTQAKAAETAALTTYATDLAELRRVEGTLLESRHVVVTATDSEPTPFWARF